ncbi:ribonuclease H2 subunit A, partial [Tanacetum coccineum]
MITRIRASSLFYADSKTLNEEKREELFESLKLDEKIGWAADVIDLRELSHESAMGLVKKVLDLGYLFIEVYVDTVGDPKKYKIKLSKIFPSSIPVVKRASISPL